MTTPSDDQLLDGVHELSRLSDRQLLERLLRTVERIETNMSVDSDYIQAALQSLDVQVGNLGIRLEGWAQQLKDATQTASDYQSLREVVNQVAEGVQQDAVTIANMAQPSAIADPATPDQASDVPTDPSQPIPSSS